MTGEIVALVVDDREDMLDILVEIPADRGHTVLRAGSVAEAMQLFLSHDVTYVIQDLQLPYRAGTEAKVEYGFDLLRKLRVHRDKDSLAICLVTAEGLSAEESTRAWKLGCSDYLVKPATVEQLFAFIDEAVAGLGEIEFEIPSEPEQPAELDGKTPAKRKRKRKEKVARKKLAARIWKDCVITLGVEIIASSRLGAPGQILEPNASVRRALELLLDAQKQGRGGDPLTHFPKAGTRYKIVNALRNLLTETFEVERGGRDPIPHNGTFYEPQFTLESDLEDMDAPDLVTVPPRRCVCSDTFYSFRCEDCDGEFVEDLCRECHRERVHDEIPDLNQ
ncbi:MAG TPA: hypothetical protein DEA08_37425 [Planctomycetes bacterium]|nr:hypothetical protein [Planctomycetota bacterium]